MFYCFVVAMSDLDVDAIHGIYFSISFLKYECMMPVKLQFAVSRASLIFQKSSQMLLAVKEGEI